MNKGELIEAVSEQSGLTKKDADTAVNAVFDSITSALKTDDSVQVTGFGSFVTKERPQRQGRNPATGEPITIAASKGVSFKPGKALKESVK